MVINSTTLDKLATGIGVLGATSNVLAASGVIDQSWSNLITALVTLGLGYLTQKPASTPATK